MKRLESNALASKAEARGAVAEKTAIECVMGYVNHEIRNVSCCCSLAWLLFLL